MLSGFYKKFLKNKLIGNIVIVICSIILIYISISLYFTKHFFFNTIVNGVDLSLKNHNAINSKFNSFIDEYSLEIIDRSGQSQIIKGDILEKGKALENEEFLYNNIKSKQKSFGWLLYLFKENKIFIKI